MVSSDVLTTLSGQPRIAQGLWYSQGSVLPKGHMLTLTTFWLNFINLALGGLIAWSLSRLWRIACATLFQAVYNERPSWEESQNFALIVNSKTALEGCMASGG